MVRDSIAARNIVYGTDKVSGPIAFLNCTGTNNEYLHLIVVLAGCEVDSIGDVYFGDDVVPLDGSGAATGTYAGHFWCHKHTGSATQAADSDLITACPTQWTSAHQLKGVAYLYVKLLWDQTIYANGLLNIAAIVKGAKCYDPRTATTVWTENSALCAAHYMMHAYGLGLAYAEIDATELTAAANTCDEAVTLADTSTEKRYRTNGVIASDQVPSDALGQLIAAMAGTVVYSGGSWFIQAGAYRTPTVTLTQTDFVGPLQVSPRLSRKDSCNAVKGTFIGPANNYAAADIPPVVNAPI